MCSWKYVKYVVLVAFLLDAADSRTTRHKAAVTVKSVVDNDQSLADTLKSKEELSNVLNQKYELVYRNEGYEKVLQCLGVEPSMRQQLINSNPIIQLSFEKGEFVLTTVSLNKVWKQHFQISQTAGYVTPDGRQVTSTFIQDNNKLSEVQEGTKDLFIIREFFKEAMAETLIVDNLMSVRLFKPINRQ